MRSLDEDIRLAVSEAIQTDSVLHVAEIAARLERSHPEERLGAVEIAERVIQAGISARVALDIERPR